MKTAPGAPRAGEDEGPARVVICTVTHNDEGELDGFVEALDELVGLAPAGSPPTAEMHCVLVDCASADGSAERARSLAGSRSWLECHALGENLGFAGGMNRAIAQARAHEPQWIWSLNADTRPHRDALEALLRAASYQPRDGRLGAVTPRLIRLQCEQQAPRLDACGMQLTRSWRHLDRGSEEIDRGQFAEPQEVFGGTGAATLYRVAALDDVAFAPGMIFDELFHSYREDAELAFRLQRRSWRTVYQPCSRLEHRRAVTPQRRQQLAAEVNRRSLQNRYLLRLYHQSLRNALWAGLPALARDAAILLYVLVRERTSLPAYAWLWRQRALVWQRRKWLQRRECGAPHQLERWFARSARPLQQTEPAR